MARKASKNPTSAFFPGLDPDGLTLKARPLPPSAQSLFLPRLVQKAASSKQMAAYAERKEIAHRAFRQWIDSLRAGTIAGLTESQVEQDFGSKLLSSLGYTTHADVLPGQPWTMTPKLAVPGAGIVDIALGHFRPLEQDSGREDTPIVMVELKGAGIDLDRGGTSRRSAVEQAWSYVNASDSARWAIVSNFVEIRLYSREKTTRHVHRILIEDLDDPERFAEFFAVFHADSLLGTNILTLNAAKLVEDTGERQEKVSDELYENYAEQRVRLIEEIQATRSDLTFDDALAASQKLLDRILFVAFAEDRQLLPKRDFIEQTAADRRPGSTRWRAFQDLFHALDVGDDYWSISKFNGELFEPDLILDDPTFQLDDDRWPTFFKTIGGYDFRDEVPVDILGQLFERSILDIEELRREGLHAHREAIDKRREAPSRRKREGVYYTDPIVTGYLVAAALDPAWEANRAELLEKHGLIEDVPGVPEEEEGASPEPSPAHARYLRDRLAWLDGLAVCDPACGSGAFLIAAYEWFEDRRLRLLDDLKQADPDAPEADGDREDWMARSAPGILKRNLFGVDLSPESVEIARLSLWIRTARRGQPLTDLAHNVTVGNSVVDDPAVDEKRAFHWQGRFPEVFERGGFDAVVGNPPYVRQELLGPIKPHLAERFRAYHGMADLYVYFYERGLSILRPGGRLAFVVTNKWMKAGYGEPLRRLFAESAWVESVIDFGHAKSFFKEADVFPCFLVARKPIPEAAPPENVSVCAIPRDLVKLDELRPLIEERSLEVERDRLGGDGWSLEPGAVNDLLVKIRERGIPLTEFAGVKPYRGVVTGLNEAFLIDTPTRNALIHEDPRSAEIIKPYLRGQDVERWSPEWAGLWMIFARRGIDIEGYPAVKRHLEAFRERLEPKPADWSGRHWPGRKPGSYRWYEIQDSTEYWREFDKPKIVYQEITWRLGFALDVHKYLYNNTVYFLAVTDPWLLAVGNSPLCWWYSWRTAQHGKDEALRFIGSFVEKLPIAQPSDAARSEAEPLVARLIEITEAIQTTRRDLLDWLQVQHEVTKPTTRLRALIALDSDGFVAEVQKARGRRKALTSAALKSLRDEYGQTIEPARALAAESLGLESRLNDLVNASYGLTPSEIRLLWDTAPPRMPLPRPEMPASD